MDGWTFLPAIVMHCLNLKEVRHVRFNCLPACSSIHLDEWLHLLSSVWTFHSLSDPTLAHIHDSSSTLALLARMVKQICLWHTWRSPVLFLPLTWNHQLSFKVHWDTRSSRPLSDLCVSLCSWDRNPRIFSLQALLYHSVSSRLRHKERVCSAMYSCLRSWC